MSSREPTYRVRQEDERLRGAAFVVVSLVTVIVVVGSVFVVIGFLRKHGKVDVPPPYAGTPVAGVERSPIEQTARGMAKYEAEQQRLGEYGWVDRSRGIARVPIDETLRWVAEDPSALPRGASPEPSQTEAP